MFTFFIIHVGLGLIFFNIEDFISPVSPDMQSLLELLSSVALVFALNLISRLSFLYLHQAQETMA